MNWNSGNNGSGGNIFITSNNQAGGITAHTVNFGPVARQMNTQLGQQLAKHLPKSAEISVTAVLGDSEAFGFANQVLEWLRGAGYTNVDGVNQAVYSQPVTGQIIDQVSPQKFDLIIGARPQA
ncbi:hypothetical protein [Xanthomonas euroxanthea]|uniref:hypothetical protein n=1 Tax=Xanthomonas euroxanthea TaxID=2259622 RepID=UPI0016104476|nr:hypothetical protein [Xanthomonas euroxanthea]MBB5766447.1 hypothetical protein [Xanthomonas euroxanthea]